ncbi:MAG: methionine aminotransferase [Crocinitomicaceae bacterium]|nr:methionine aminotransferase [Crocinitomicaceae bacterium]
MSKLPNVGTTIFTTMSKLANDTGAINLSQGFPNFPVDSKLVEILRQKANENVHQYMPMTGFPELMIKIRGLVESSYGRKVNTSKELLVAAGATQAIFTTILALVDKGEEVIVLDPSYDCYEPAIILAGGKSTRISLNEEFLPDWDLINSTVTNKTRMLIINSPHNPSGRVWKNEDIKQLELLMERYPQLLLLSDEVYEYISFEQKHISIHSIPSLRERSIIVSSFGKTFHITGWKMGCLVAPENLMIEINKVHQFNVFSVNSVAQATLSTYLEHVNVQELGSFYQTKRDLFRKLMSKSKFQLLPCEGTYFQTVDYSAISKMNDVEFCKQLTTDHGVAAIPVSVFNDSGKDQNIIRFCFAKDDETIIKATDLLCKI